MKSSGLALSALSAAMLAALMGCAVEMPAPAPAPPRVVQAPVPAVVSIDPPLVQPAPIMVGWAPPPMLVEVPPPPPYPGAYWTGGYWSWQGQWVWATGRWLAPPQPGYGWVQPYYEHRADAVIFIGGHWAAPGVVFVPPPPGLAVTLAAVAPGVVQGPRPIGPPGVFVPPPPGSRVGLVVPAPIGTAPAVVTSAPPVTNIGMRIQANTATNTVNNTQVTNITNIENVTNVTVVAPASATASGRAYEAAIPAQAHLAAALPPVVHSPAPRPASPPPRPAIAAGHTAPAPQASPTQQQQQQVPSIPHTPQEMSPPPAKAVPQPTPAAIGAVPRNPDAVPASVQPHPTVQDNEARQRAEQQQRAGIAAKAAHDKAVAEQHAGKRKTETEKEAAERRRKVQHEGEKPAQ